MRRLTFGLPASMMFLATLVFWLGRRKFAVVPPAGKAWAREVFSTEGLKLIASLGVIYVFVACFWALWDQSNGQTWTLQAESSLMDKTLFPGFKILPAQIQVVNGLLILVLTPVFSFVIYPVLGKFFKMTPLRRIGLGLFTIASSFLIVGRIEATIQAGHTISVWWQILAYVVLTAAEVLVSITALEFSYKQAPLRIKSFIMALFLLSTSLGNMITASVNQAIIRPLHADSVEVGAETWITVEGADKLIAGQKIDVGGENGITVTKSESKPEKMSGTFLVGKVDAAKSRVRLVDTVNREAVASTGTFDSAKAKVSTYKLVGPEYFNFFAMAMAGIAVLFIFFAMLYKEKTHVRTEEADATAA
jgi:POT family proton-dependent oligopeptide transporter